MPCRALAHPRVRLLADARPTARRSAAPRRKREERGERREQRRDAHHVILQRYNDDTVRRGWGERRERKDGDGDRDGDHNTMGTGQDGTRRDGTASARAEADFLSTNGPRAASADKKNRRRPRETEEKWEVQHRMWTQRADQPLLMGKRRVK